VIQCPRRYWRSICACGRGPMRLMSKEGAAINCSPNEPFPKSGSTLACHQPALRGRAVASDAALSELAIDVPLKTLQFLKSFLPSSRARPFPGRDRSLPVQLPADLSLTDRGAVKFARKGKGNPTRTQGFPSPIPFNPLNSLLKAPARPIRIWISRTGYAAWSYSIEISLPV